MRRLLPLLLLVFPHVLYAAVPYQVADLKVTPDSVGSSDPLFGTSFNGRIIFSALNPTTGREPWITDGTAAGTVLLKDIAPGRNDSYPGNFVAVGNLVYFNVVIGDALQTWQTDGTTAGTRQADITGYPLAALGTKLLTLDDSNELKITDGTVAGTTPLAALGSSTSADGFFIGPADDHSLYLASGWGIWRTDGTVAGTKLLTGTHVASAVQVGSSLVFIGSNTASGREPWISDGTAAGTHMITELVAGTGSAFGPIQRIPMAAAGNRAVFATQNGDVWSTDGTASGTSMLLKSPATTAQTIPMASFNGNVYFSGTDANGQELWRTDGTVAGTSLFKDINPGPASSGPLEFGATSSQLFFFADDGTHGSELWATDGSAAGTRLVRDVNPGPHGSLSGYQISFAFGNRIYFDGSDALHGGEPWSSDGTESGTQLIADVFPEVVGSSVPYDLVPAVDGLYFVTARTDDTSAPSLWKTDGSASGTRRLLTLVPGSSDALPPVIIGTTAFFVNGGALWKTDGTPSGTLQVKPIDASGIDALVAIDNHLYVHDFAQFNYGFSELDPSGNEVLRLGSSNQLVPFNGKAFYFATSENPNAIAYTDGTAAGTHTIWHVPTGLTMSSPFYPAGGSLFFFMSTNPGGSGNDLQLWKTNGTADGTQFVKSFGATAVTSKSVTAAGPTLFFVLGTDLWLSNGTADGTVKLKTVGQSTFAWTDAFAIAGLGDRVLLVGSDAGHGQEPWVSDGTAEGTKLLADINPGAASSISYTTFCVVDGIAYFTADDGSHGPELWQTDGTAAGTKLAADIEPGSGGSLPYHLTRANDLLYFSANTTATGLELWAMPLPKSVAITTFDVTVKKSDPSATVTVRLTAPAASRITVDYATVDSTAKAGTDYVAKSGTLTFEAGDSQKTIAIALLDDGAIGTTKTFLIHLMNAGAPLAQSTAAVDIVNDHTSADLGLLPRLNANAAPMWTIFNNGPSPASDVRLCYTSTWPGSFVVCDNPFELASGQTHTNFIDGGLYGRSYIGRVVGAQADPNAANNLLTFTSGGVNPTVNLAPVMPQAGKPATIWFTQFPSASPLTYTLTSSDPTILPLPASVTFPANVGQVSITVTPIRPGNVTIRAATNPIALAVRVVPGTENRLPVMVDALSQNLLLHAGGITETAFGVGGNTLDGFAPTGTINVLIDGQVAATLPVYAGKTPSYVLPTGPAGQTHTLKAFYSGDLHFIFEESPQHDLFVSLGTASAAANALRGPGENVDVIIRGGPGVVPTGTVKVTAGSTTYAASAALAPLDSAAAHVVIPGIPASAGTLSLSYSGDSNFVPSNFQVSIVGRLGRSVRH